KISFFLENRHDETDPAIFEAVVGAVVGQDKLGRGEMVTAEKDDDPIQIGDPIYRASSGHVLMGGRMPVVRGKRSRAAAPGTQFALELDPVKKVDRYYMLSKELGDKVKVFSEFDHSRWKMLEYAPQHPDVYLEVDEQGVLGNVTDVP